MTQHPSYYHVFLTFVRNSLVRELTFRSNFLIQCISSLSWTLMNVGFYLLIFSHVNRLTEGAGWGKWEFFIFLATTMFVNSVVQALFMPNAQRFSELIRQGGLDFALLKPIDTQFLVSLQRIEWSSLANFIAGAVLLTVSLWTLTNRLDLQGAEIDGLTVSEIDQQSPAFRDGLRRGDQILAVAERPVSDNASFRTAVLNSDSQPQLRVSRAGATEEIRLSLPATPAQRLRYKLQLTTTHLLLYPVYIAIGITILYSLMISLAATSVWLGRNQTLYNFWFYITNFSRYPMEIYGGSAWGDGLRFVFTFVIPVLVVVNVPARIMAQPLHPNPSVSVPQGLFAIAAALGSLIVSRWIFTRALMSYRSASS